jgi:hypothetical protein
MTILLMAAMVLSAVPVGMAGASEGGAGPRAVTDNTNDLIIPEGESYELSGNHSYKRTVNIMGVLKVKPYNGLDGSTGMLWLKAPNITIGAYGAIDASGRGHGGGGGGTNYYSSVTGGRGGVDGKGGDGSQYYYSSSSGGGGGGSNGGKGGSGSYPGQDGTELKGGNGGGGSYAGGAGGAGYGSGGGGGGASYSGGGGGGGGGTGGKDGSWYNGGKGGGPFGGTGANGASYSGGSTGSNGGYGEAKGNGDSTVDLSVWLGSGGGGGGTTNYYYSGGAGGGGAGGGAVILQADNSLTVSGGVAARGGSGGMGGGNYYSYYYQTGDGGGGAGGGIVLFGSRVIISGSVDALGKDKDKASAANGGTVKLLYGEVLQNNGVVGAGRVFINARPKMNGLNIPLPDTQTYRKPLFKWYAAEDPEGDPITYQIELSSNPAFSSPKQYTGITETSWTPPQPLAGTMFWRVRAADQCGGGSWSEVRKFTVDDKAPSSKVDALPEYVNSQEFLVSWKGADNPGGSGIEAYIIMVTDNGGAPYAWTTVYNGTSAWFRGAEGHSYLFWSIAVDFAENTEVVLSDNKVGTTVDSVAPTASISAIARYQSKPNFMVSWTGRDVTSGIADYSVYLSIDGAGFTAWQENTTETSAQYRGQDGHMYTFFVRARDMAGNVQDPPGTEKYISTSVDGAAPETRFAPTAPYFGHDPMYIGGTSIIELDGNDNFAGVEKTFYMIDNRAQQDYLKGFRELQGGSHNITFWSIDAAGNEESRKTAWFWVDGEPPVTSLNLLGPNWTTESRVFISGQTLISFDAFDKGSGVNRTMYNIDGSGWQTYKAPFKLPKAGVHALKYQSVDNLGYRDAEKNISIVMDIWEPASVAVAETTTSSTDVSVELRGVDLESGLAAVYYRIVKLGDPPMNFVAGANVTITAQPDGTRDGTYTIEFYAVDNVGNREPTRKVDIIIDTKGTLVLNIKGSPTVSEPTFHVTGSVEPGSNVTVNGLRVLVRSDGTFDYHMELREGKNKIVVVSTDKAGNSITTTKYATYNKPQETGTLFPLIITVAVIVAVAVAAMVLLRPKQAPAR